MILDLGNRGRREKGERGGSEGVDRRHDVHGTKRKGRDMEREEAASAHGTGVDDVEPKCHFCVPCVPLLSLHPTFIPILTRTRHSKQQSCAYLTIGYSQHDQTVRNRAMEIDTQ